MDLMDMTDMDLEDEESTDNKDNHHYAQTKPSIDAPTTTILAGSSPSQEGFVASQEGFVGGFGTGLKSAALHPTLSPRYPFGAGSNTWGDTGVATSRVPERLTWCDGNDTPQAQTSSTASAAGKTRSHKQCADCGIGSGTWGEVVPAGQSLNRASSKSLRGDSCGACGGYVVVGRDSGSKQQDWSKTPTNTFTTPSAPSRAVGGRHDKHKGNKGSDKGSGKGSSMPKESLLIPLVPSVAEDEDQARGARAKQRKRGREEEDSEPGTALSSADSRTVRRRRGDDLITPMPPLSWGQSMTEHHSDDGATQNSGRPSSGSEGGGGGGGGEGNMTAMPVKTRSDPPSDPVSKRRKSDQSHGDSKSIDSSTFKVRSVIYTSKLYDEGEKDKTRASLYSAQDGLHYNEGVPGRHYLLSTNSSR